MKNVYSMPYLRDVRDYSERQFEIPSDTTHVRLFHGTSTAYLDVILEKGW